MKKSGEKTGNRKLTKQGASAAEGTKNYYIGFVIFLLSVFVLLSLFSYSPLDNCINVASNEKTRNICGVYGAIISDLMFQFFGLSSWLFSVVPLVWSFILFLNPNFEKFFFFGQRFATLVIAAMSGSAMFAFFRSYGFATKMMFGGYVGYYLSNITEDRVGNIVGFMVFFFVFAPSLFFAIKTQKKGGSYILRLLTRLFNRFTLKKIFFTIFNILTFRFLVNLFRHKKGILISIDELFSKKHSKQNSPNASNIFVSPLEPSGSRASLSRNSDSKNAIETKPTHDALKIERNIDESYKAPDIGFLKKSKVESIDISDDLIMQRKNHLLEVLREFSVHGEIVSCNVGPVVSMFELKPTAGTKAARVIGLANDVARTMRVSVVRIADVPTRGVMGIELPNPTRAEVNLRDIIESSAYDREKIKIPIVLGKDITGNPIVEDLTKMPHLLIAGTTGSGKSVGVNAMILSILYALGPDECKFVMIDPKMLELSLYEGIPHLLSPVITDPQNAIAALKWVVSEMLSRYKKMSNLGVRNITGYNQKAEIAKMRGAKIVRDVEVGYNVQTGEILTEKIIEDAKTMPYIVVVIDEMADLMVASGKEVEVLVQRVAQMARAAGIHIIMATQRPSVDVITGVIKANFPTRISYQVTSKIDSRTILGEQGAEQLLGLGDMLYSSLGKKLKRVHGPFVSEGEVEKVVSYLKSVYKPEYVDIIKESGNSGGSSGGSEDGVSDGDDDIYKQAIKIVMQTKKTSISYVQRQLRIGYNKAANLIEQMEKDGILTGPDRTGKRSIIGDESNE